MLASFRNTLLAVSLLAASGQARATEAPSVPAATKTDAASIGNQALARAQAQLGAKLIARLSKKGEDAVISPASLAMLFAILGEESTEPTWRQAVLKLFGPEDKTEDFGRLLSARAKFRENYPAAQGADLLVFPPDATVADKILESLGKKGVETARKDLSKSPDVAWVNDRIKEATKGAIPDLLRQPFEAPVFAALDALHFKAQWKQTFDRNLTIPAPFQNSDGSQGEINLMRSPVGSYAFRTEGQFIAVDLPFADNRSSLVLITSREKPLKAEEFSPTASWLGGDGFDSRQGDVAFPRFALSGDHSLLPALDDLGLAEARKAKDAFSVFGSGANLSQVLQRVVIEADEQGAEAAAATAVVITRALQDDGAIHVRVDRPFLFALRDKESGLILVSGYVGNAPKGKGE